MLEVFKKENDGSKRRVTILGYNYIKTWNNCGFFGDYKSWDDVRKLCTGYDSDAILEKTLDATLKVKNGKAVFERDSSIMDKPEYSVPLLASLYKVATENNNILNVVDLGGALGSHYFHKKDFMKPVKIKNWTVIEQAHYTKIGNEKVADGVLNFKESLDDIEDADVLLCSGTIQYFEKPYEWIDEILSKGYKWIIFDRTAFSLEHKNRLTLQKVCPAIYEATYPAWFLDENEFLAKFEKEYDIILDFKSNIDRVPEVPSVYKGFLFKKK